MKSSIFGASAIYIVTPFLFRYFRLFQTIYLFLSQTLFSSRTPFLTAMSQFCPVPVSHPTCYLCDIHITPTVLPVRPVKPDIFNYTSSIRPLCSSCLSCFLLVWKRGWCHRKHWIMFKPPILWELELTLELFSVRVEIKKVRGEKVRERKRRDMLIMNKWRKIIWFTMWCWREMQYCRNWPYSAKYVVKLDDKANNANYANYANILGTHTSHFCKKTLVYSTFPGSQWGSMGWLLDHDMESSLKLNQILLYLQQDSMTVDLLCINYFQSETM